MFFVAGLLVAGDSIYFGTGPSGLGGSAPGPAFDPGDAGFPGHVTGDRERQSRGRGTSKSFHLRRDRRSGAIVRRGPSTECWRGTLTLAESAAASDGSECGAYPLAAVRPARRTSPKAFRLPWVAGRWKRRACSSYLDSRGMDGPACRRCCCPGLAVSSARAARWNLGMVVVMRLQPTGNIPIDLVKLDLCTSEITCPTTPVAWCASLFREQSISIFRRLAGVAKPQHGRTATSGNHNVRDEYRSGAWRCEAFWFIVVDGRAGRCADWRVVDAGCASTNGSDRRRLEHRAR